MIKSDGSKEVDEVKMVEGGKEKVEKDDTLFIQSSNHGGPTKIS